MSNKKKYIPKLQQKRTKPSEKAWYILKPFIMYTIVKTIAMLALSIAIPALPFKDMAQKVALYDNLLSALINAIASVIGVAFVINDFVKEVVTSGELDIDAGIGKQLFAWFKEGLKKCPDKMISYGAVISLGISSSLALNILIELFSVQSSKYDTVEEIQYSVPLWLGLILYGIVSPFVEEIVFRGITYNRMKRYFGTTVSVISTALLFGMFHANMPQFLYGTCMGILMALCYEWVNSFGAAVLFHMSANIFIYLYSYFLGDLLIVTFGFFAVFAVISTILIIILIKLQNKSRSL